ncbi:sensor histidine kinase [Cohnella cholangitidis]|uniref:histidine kinase n=1 Tax=Cohnella cholangitidis TaxID=2598458 RepID=A0A7G5BW52_9BACL|nr:sensor histidine kinase [Cohnella cholangitidis]QMV41186.1 sensor histidine kinase [Cohnella cholangitidis]
MIKLGRLNTLRNQIFIGFLLVMIIVLALAGVFTYDRVSVLLRNSAERHIQQTAIQATGKLEELLRQIDTLTAQIATNGSVQRLLIQESNGKPATFGERQSIQHIAGNYQAYANGIRSLELYTTDYRRLFPLDDFSLNSRISADWINRVDHMKGGLVWFGLDPNDSDTVVAVRSVRIIDRSFSHGGYLMVRIERSYFELTDSAADSRELMVLQDGAGRTLASGFPPASDVEAVLARGEDTIEIDGEQYIAVRQRSESTGWTLSILTPVDYSTEGISVLRTVIVVTGVTGGLLFLILTFILSTMITRPILNLMKAMRGARLGSLKPNPKTSATMEINELNHTYNQMVDYLNELIEVVYQKEITQSRTELKALQAQINPHFLFNTLEALYWALEDKGEDELAHIVIAMSGLFRYVISRPDEDEWVTIGDELDHAERYLQIMEMRMVDRLTWTIEADDASRSVPIPKLLIQPLVENAVLHGIEQKIGPGTVVIRVEPSDRPGYSTVSIIDDGPGMDDPTLNDLREAMTEGRSVSSKGSGVGLANVQQRLELYYESMASGLEIGSAKGEGAIFSFEIPSEYGGH